MRPWLLFIAAVHASEDCEVIDLPGSLKLDFSTSELLWNNLGGLGPALSDYSLPADATNLNGLNNVFELRGDPWAEPSVWVVLGLLLLCCFLCLLCLLFWLCCGKPGKEKLYVYQVPDLPMKQVEVAFRA